MQQLAFSFWSPRHSKLPFNNPWGLASGVTVISQFSMVAAAVAVGCIFVDCSSFLIPVLLVCDFPTFFGMGRRIEDLSSPIYYLASCSIDADGAVFSFLAEPRTWAVQYSIQLLITSMLTVFSHLSCRTEGPAWRPTRCSTACCTGHQRRME